MNKIIAVLLVLTMVVSMGACGSKPKDANVTTVTEAAETTAPAETEAEATEAEASGTRIIVDLMERQVEVPAKVEQIVCIGVGALRYTSYMQAQDLVVGIEEYDTKGELTRPYSYVNNALYKDLPVVGGNGDPYIEEIINVMPQVIVMSQRCSVDPDELQTKTGIPVVVIPITDSMLDENTYETFRMLGELYGMEERADEVISYLEEVRNDFETRMKDVTEHPSVYVGGVSFKGIHGFEGTEANYAPFVLLGANNLADTTGQKGAFDVDLEQVLAWDPDVIFLDFNGMELINEDYAKNPDYYNSLTAVKEGRVYSQISFRSYATNLDTALLDGYYAATVLYPDQFADIDIAEKADEIFTKLLGSNPYDALKEAGYEFKPLTIGE